MFGRLKSSQQAISEALSSHGRSHESLLLLSSSRLGGRRSRSNLNHHQWQWRYGVNPNAISLCDLRTPAVSEITAAKPRAIYLRDAPPDLSCIGEGLCPDATEEVLCRVEIGHR
jgi:hypothetical protein